LQRALADRDCMEEVLKSAILGLLILALVPCVGRAQSSDYSKGHGYAYFAPGGRVTSGSGSRATIHMGGGYERFFTRHVGAGAEPGFLGTVEPDDRQVFTTSWGTFSLNFVARLRAKDENTRTKPFVTGGYTLMVRNEADSGVNFGGGFNWWFEKRVGLRVEVRDHLLLGPYHLVGAHIGLTFR